MRRPAPPAPRLDLDALAGKLSVPTLPKVVVRLKRLASDPGVSLKEIGALIAQDGPTAARVLRVANSALVAPTEPIRSVQHAVAVLGMRTLTNIVLQTTIIGRYSHLAHLPGFDLEGLWRHSILTARIAELLADRARRPTERFSVKPADISAAAPSSPAPSKAWNRLDPDEYYTLGLLHDLGRVVLLDAIGEEYVQMLRSSEERGLPSSLVELRKFGFHHCDLGASIATLWGLPDVAARSIRTHHDPFGEAGVEPEAVIVPLADQMAHRIQEGRPPLGSSLMPAVVGSWLGLSAEELQRVGVEAQALLPSLLI